MDNATTLLQSMGADAGADGPISCDNKTLLMGLVASTLAAVISECLGASPDTKHNGIGHAVYNIITSRCWSTILQSKPADGADSQGGDVAGSK